MRTLVLTPAAALLALFACAGPRPAEGTADAGAAGLGSAADAGTPGSDAGSPSADGGSGGSSADAGPAGPPDAGSADAGSCEPGGCPDAGADAGTGSTSLPPRPSPIAAENLLPGSADWRLSAYSRNVAAYAETAGAAPGGTVVIHAAAAAPATARWELWRIGYYGGARGRRLARGGPVQLPAFTAPVLDPKTGAVSAQWPAAFSIQIPDAAPTGIYLVKIVSDQGETYALVVVRESVPAAAILYPVSINTYQAYNDWGGTSLYTNTRADWASDQAYAVSFDRPYAHGNGTGELFVKDLDFIVFAESQGYDLGYAADVDVDRDPSLAEHRRMISFQGHSEYWTGGLRDAVEAAVARGTNLAFFAANNAYWQVRYADASRRLLIGYKEHAALDPANTTDRPHVTTRFRDAPVSRPENALIGEMFGSWIWAAAPLTVTDPSSWLWTGAGVQRDSIIVAGYGDEVDHRFANGREPAGVSVIGDALVEGYDGHFARGETTIYTAPSGALVFSAGSIGWSGLLSSPGRWDARVQQLVANLFSRFAGDGTLGPAALRPIALPPGARAPSFRAGAQVSTVTSALLQPTAVAAAPNGDAIVLDQNRVVRVTPAGVVTAIAGGPAGFADGAVDVARFREPRGLAVAANGDIFVADTANNRIRVISGGMVRTLAGSQRGFAEGAGAQALFAQPMALALTAAGTVLVADTWNQRLREVTLAGQVSTWAGDGQILSADGPGAQASLNYPLALALLPGGDVVLAEPATGRLRRVAGAAPHTVSGVAGALGFEGYDDGAASSAGVSETLALAARPDGQVILVDGATARVRALKTGAIDTLAGGTRGGTADGAGANAGFAFPRGVASAPDGSLLVVDAREHTLRRIVLAP